MSLRSKRNTYNFNSIKVQLKRSANGIYTRPCVNFNSIKVQLKQDFPPL